MINLQRSRDTLASRGMDNIESFNRTVAALFALLFSKFPQPILKFDTEHFRKTSALPKAADGGSEDIGSALEWLARDGFIRFSSKAGFGQLYLNVELTQKGLAALNQIPDSLTPSVTVGDRLKQLAREATSGVVMSLVKIALGAPIT